MDEQNKKVGCEGLTGEVGDDEVEIEEIEEQSSDDETGDEGAQSACFKDEEEVASSGEESSMPLSGSSSESNDEMDGDDEITKQLLKQILTVNKIKKKENKKKDKEFIPSIKKYLKYDVRTKSQKLTPRITKNLTLLARSILKGEIPILLDHSDRRTLKQIISNKMSSYDRKLVLVEDYRLHGCFKEAVKIIESSLKK